MGPTINTATYGDPALEITVWTDPVAFERYTWPWTHLAQQTTPDPVFLLPEWFQAAWQWRSRQDKLRLLGVWQGNTLIGIAPLVQFRDKHRGLSCQGIGLLTVPDTQYCDILAAHENRAPVCRAIARYLAVSATEWDYIDFSYLPERGNTSTHLGEALSAYGLRWNLSHYGDNPGLALTDGWETYYGRRSRRLKKGNNLIENRLKKGGHEVILKHHTSNADTSPEELHRTLEEAILVSARSWKATSGLSLDASGPNEFIKALTNMAINKNALSLWILYIDGQPAAMEYQIHCGDHIYALRSDFDENLKELSPGTYMNWKMLEQLFQTNARYYLMGPGENVYKLRWAEEFIRLNRLIGYSRTAKGRLLAFLDLDVRPHGRRFKHFVRRAKPKKDKA